MDLVAALATVTSAPPQAHQPFDLFAALQGFVPDRDSRVSPVEPVRVPCLIVEEKDEKPLRGRALAKALEEQRAAQPLRDPWPASWFEVNDPADAHRCRMMWAEVLRVSLIDVCEGVAKASTAKKAWQRTRVHTPPDWIGSQGFFDVCNLAGFDGRAVQDRLMPKLGTPEGAMEVWRSLSVAGGVHLKSRATDD